MISLPDEEARQAGKAVDGLSVVIEQGTVLGVPVLRRLLDNSGVIQCDAHDDLSDFAAETGTMDETATWPLKIRFDSILHDEPEAALPVAYGSDEDDWAGQTEDLGTVERMSQPSGETVMHTGAFTPGDARLGWLMNGASASQQDGIDIAAAAKAHLAKTALRDFSPAEQQQIIEEGADEHLGSRNDDRLDIDGTFYAAMSPASDNDDSLW